MRADRPRGFTLLEVLIAFAIVALSLVALFKGVGFGLGATGRAERYDIALSRARSHLAAVGPDVDRLLGLRRGDDGGGFHWSIEVRPFVVNDATAAPAGGLPTLYTVVVTESWRDGDRVRTVALASERLGNPP